MNAHTSKSGCGPTVPMPPRAVRKCASALAGVPLGPLEEAQFPMGPPHQGPPRASKNFGVRQIPGTKWFGGRGQGLARQWFLCSCPPPPRVPPAPPPPPRTLVEDAVPQNAAKCPAQRDVPHLGARKMGGIGGIPTAQHSLWLRPHTWPASSLNHGVTTKPPTPTPCVPLHCHVLHFRLHLLDVIDLLLHPPLPRCLLFLPVFLLLLFLPPPLLLLLLPHPLLLPRVRRLLTRGVAGRWGGGLCGGGSPGRVGLRGHRSLRWRWGWSLNNIGQTAYHQGEGRLLTLLHQLPQLGGFHGCAKSDKAGLQRALGWRVLGGWGLEVKRRCTPRCVWGVIVQQRQIKG